MTIKRLILLLITIIAIIPLFGSLVASFTQPQVQSDLQLYQDNLILQASEIQLEKLNLSKNFADIDLVETRKNLIGKDPKNLAEEQYKEVRESSNNNLADLEKQLQKKVSDIGIEPENNSQKIELKTTIEKQKKYINKLDLKLGIIEAERGETQTALKTWQNLINKTSDDNIQQTAIVLTGLWSQPPQISPDTETQLNNNLDGWFRYRALKQFYQIQDNQNDLLILQNQEQEKATQAILKLVLIAIIPIVGGVMGFSLLIFLLIQLLFKKEASLLAKNSGVTWETPWNIETIWQVLIVGFFFIGQIVLPLFFGFLRLDISNFSLRGKAIYVLISYLSMAISGLLVLYFSIKPFFPLSKDWFRFQWLSNWFLWGFGGYLIALPLVVIISLINQVFWNGQGGSNPLLFLALESQDTIVLAIFFFTASIAAPVFEEIIFRGFLLPSLTRYFPVWGAIIISSLIFALAHLNLSEVLPLATLGIVLGFVYTRSRNMLSSMLLHSLWNSGTLVSLFILGSGSN